jgi:hypothetical protein
MIKPPGLGRGSRSVYRAEAPGGGFPVKFGVRPAVNAYS